MREIKFRAWDTKSKKYIQHDLMPGDGHDGYLGEREDDTAIYSEDCIFQQFTGLKDKNGKDIYEGDIIKEEFDATCSIFEGREIICYPGEYIKKKFRLVEVKWDGLGFVFDGPKNIGFITNRTQEVVGNIFENSELLKK